MESIQVSYLYQSNEKTNDEIPCVGCTKPILEGVQIVFVSKDKHTRLGGLYCKACTIDLTCTILTTLNFPDKRESK